MGYDTNAVKAMANAAMRDLTHTWCLLVACTNVQNVVISRISRTELVR